MDMNLRTICPCLAAALLTACAPRTPDVTTEPFGTLSTGEPVTLYRLSNGTGSSMEVIDYGCRGVRICVPDRNGVIADIVPGYDDIRDFETGSERFFGALIGRYGNRIAKGKFTLFGEEHELTINNGPNSLHGGPTGFHARVWDAIQIDENTVQFNYVSADGEEGFPGNLEVEMT